MSIEGLIGIIAGFIAISGVLLAFVKYLWPRLEMLGTQDPNKEVTKERLSWRDVSVGFEKKLIPTAKELKPDAIFGINRGGAIVGGVIAKKIDLDHIHIVNVDNRYREVIGHNKIQLEPRSKILLIDDAIRTGSHMKTASEYLVDKYGKDIEIRKMVVLRQELTETSKPLCSPEYYAFSTKMWVILPWDKE